MKKLILSLFILLSMQNVMYAQESNDDEPEEIEEVEITCEIIDETKYSHRGHRTPPSIPVVYLNKTEFTIEFSNPCYETTLFVIDIRNGSVVYEIPVLDGLTQVCLPKSLNGEYELHLHRGCFCFSGIINL